MNPCPVLSSQRKLVFNVTQEQYEALWNACEGRCPLCNKPFANTINRHDVFDHDHETGHVRGLLCGACNHTLGFHKDSWWLAVNEYLRHTPAERLGIHVRHRDWNDR